MFLGRKGIAYATSLVSIVLSKNNPERGIHDMENLNTLPDTNNTIINLTKMIDTLNPSWIQELVMGIYINDIQEIQYKKENL